MTTELIPKPRSAGEHRSLALSPGITWGAAIVLLMLWAGCLSHGQVPPHPKNPLGTGQDIVAAGHTIFNQTCTGCHGRDGGEGERAPALVGERRFFRLSDSSIFDTIKNGIPGTAMPPFSNLPDNDIWRIVVFIRAMRGSASETDVPGNVEHGKAIFDGKGGCPKCHMVNGKGGTIGPDLSNIGAQLTLQQLRDALSKERPIPLGYRPIQVVTIKGEKVEGIAKDEDGFSVQILDRQDKLHLYDTTELREVTHGKASLMPHDYDKVLTPEEYQDMVAMLSKQVVMELPTHRQGEGEAGR